ncbi:LuxR family transcriptional regulator [Rhodophyticola sp. CCM32]|uniref:helix-turn-helix transcriptional regulator n=1 Tax=Rhodophyticola sp. CCM32 TaxID=2916397 RepID=UPI00107FCE8A|nr:LuxR family transcriptional regulator [Rhodophyticola sp. CCM32]QBY00503.1 LuxR family transcriptional regulator [Rhodophyticola sp. CCM32]
MKLNISEAFVEDVAHFERSDDKPNYLRKFGRQFGLSDLAYMQLNAHNLAAPPVELITTYSKAWEERYVAMGYEASDPVVSNSFRGLLPFDWSSVPSSDKHARKFFGEAAEFGVSAKGLSIPIRAPDGGQALFSVSSQESAGEWRLIKKHLLSDLIYFGFLVHSSITRTTETKNADVVLSPREKDVLIWSSEGKSCWETAKILGLSERTVNFYIQNASAKLGAASKTQAVAIAIQRRLILHTIRK